MSLEAITTYLTETYDPEAILLYGSFADGTNGPQSDFDALVIAGGPARHDGRTVAGTELDVFIFPPETFTSSFDPEEFSQLAGGTLLLDRTGLGADLMATVEARQRAIPEKNRAEVFRQVDWCRKMLRRTERGDAEGLFRWHWLLTDSLEIYMDLRRAPYRGPKKSLQWMEQHNPDAFRLYQAALADFRLEPLAAWVDYLDTIRKEEEAGCPAPL